MTARRARKAHSLVAKSAELALAVPQVIAHRLARMAAAGAMPSPRDRKEFQRMSSEKTSVFNESWNAMAMQAFRANQTLSATLFRSFWTPLAGRRPTAHSVAAQMQNAAMGILAKGMAPVHRAAVSNAKRLAKAKAR